MEAAPPPAIVVSDESLAKEKVRDVRPSLRGAWLLLQLVPSPGIAVGDTQTSFALGWQVTPILYSWAMDPRLVPLRSFVVEPIVRQSGSIELHFSPKYVGRHDFEDNFGFAGGVRSYFPLSERGDALSFSLGVSIAHSFGRISPSFDAGIYTLFGGIGLLFTMNPLLEDSRFEGLVRLRYF